MTARLRLLTTIPRRLDAAVCSGAVANAARSVCADQVRAAQRLDSAAALREMQRRGLDRVAS